MFLCDPKNSKRNSRTKVIYLGRGQKNLKQQNECTEKSHISYEFQKTNITRMMKPQEARSYVHSLYVNTE